MRKPEGRTRSSKALGYWLILGLYLTLRGYHSLDGDQAYRLPLLLHAQTPSLYADDPFVGAFGAFNPHRGSLLVLRGATAVCGLSGGLFALFVATFLATCRGIDRLARHVWPEWASWVGWVAITLVLTAKAGNIGTNHLFEAMLLDRLMALAAGWWAIASVLGQPERGWWRAGVALGGAAIIHPSLGLQLAIVVAGSWILWALFPGQSRIPWQLAVRGVAVAGLAVLPGLMLNLDAGGSLQQGLSAEDFWTLSVELQNPQHMLPHLWRMPQWLAWGAYLVLAALAVIRSPSPSVPRVRLVLMLIVVLSWLAAAWVGIEVLHNLRITIFQPFRLATVARGLSLVLIAGRLAELWAQRRWFPRTRAVLIGVALAGDWMLVVVTLAEAGATLAEWLGQKTGRSSGLAYGILLAWGLSFPGATRHGIGSLASLAGPDDQSDRACFTDRKSSPLRSHALVSEPFRPVEPALRSGAGLDGAGAGDGGRNLRNGLLGAARARRPVSAGSDAHRRHGAAGPVVPGTHAG